MSSCNSSTGPWRRLRNSFDLEKVVLNLWPGETVHLKILRLGRPMTVAVVLDFRPIDLNANTAAAWIQDRNQKARSIGRRSFRRWIRGAGAQASTGAP